MKCKKLVALAVASALCAGLVVPLTACGGKGDAFTWLLMDKESSNYYSDYDNNPAVEYVLNKTWETVDEEGNPISGKVNIDFSVPPSGSFTDTLTNMIGTHTEPDIFDTTMYSGTVGQLYLDGYILDLTPYVEKYMPNYMALLEREEEVARYAYTTVDGEDRMLSLKTYAEVDVMNNVDWGWCYRRDWIVKYGKDPSTGAAFTGRFTKNTDGSERSGSPSSSTVLPDGADGDSWEDNVRFPSWYGMTDNNTMGDRDFQAFIETYKEAHPDWDGGDPVTISDWEWMFRLFKQALADNGITQDIDGYVFTMYYPGYIRNGDLVSSFGHGGPWLYIETQEDGTREGKFGGGSDTMRTYLECLNSWYNEGWLNKNFAQNKDAYFEIDSDLVYQGNVGLWIGVNSTLGTRIHSDMQPNTEGIIAFGARQPINDKYGESVSDPDSVKYIEPDTMWAGEPVGGSLVLSKKVLQKADQLPFLFKFLDYFYSEEGARVGHLGLSKEQLEEEDTLDSVREFYNDYGVPDGSYYINEEGKYQLYPIVENDSGDLQNALCAMRLGVGYEETSERAYGNGENYLHSLAEWGYYPNTGFLGGLTLSNASVDDLNTIAQIEGPLEQLFMYIEVPKFIMGQNDIFNESAWRSYRSGLNQDGRVDTMVDILNKYLN